MRIASKAADRVEDQIDAANITQATVAFGLHRGELGFNATYRRSEPFQCVLKACATHDVQQTYKDKRGVDLVSDALPFSRLWYGVYDAASDVIEMHEHKGEFKEPRKPNTSG